MVKDSIYITVVESVLDDLKTLQVNGELPNKFSIDFIMKKVRETSLPLKEEKKAKKGTGKLSHYNIFVKDNMSKVVIENPTMTGSERMTEIGRLWQIYKSDNPNYKTDEKKTDDTKVDSDDDKKEKTDDDDDKKTDDDDKKEKKKKEKKEKKGKKEKKEKKGGKKEDE